MKKMIAILLCCVLALSALAMAEQPATGTDLTEEIILVEGFVQEITGEYVLLLTSYGQELQANLSEDTAYMTEGLEIGDYVYVAYNGQQTFSLPPQISVISLGFAKLTGVIEELSEDGFLLRTEEYEDGVFVVGDAATAEGLTVDMPVTVYFDGKMSRSLPLQIHALHVRMAELEGIVDEVTETGFLMTDADGVQYDVFVGEDTVELLQPGVGEAVRVVFNGVMTMSLPAQVNALEVLPCYATMTIVD